MKPIFAAIPIFAAAGLGAITASLETTVHPVGNPVALDIHEEKAAASLLGQFRTSMTGWLWLRTDLYLHNGVQMRPLTDAEKAAGLKGVGAENNEEGAALGDDNLVNLVPNRENDFRGVFGDVERAVSAYKDMSKHAHNNPRQTLPLFRIMVWFDPGFLKGWRTGAALIASDHSDSGTDRAIKFLEEGLDHNPGQPQLLTDQAVFFAARKRQFEEAIPKLEEARRNGLELIKHLDEDGLESLQLTYRCLTICLWYQARVPDVRRYAKEGLQIFPGDPVLSRMISRFSRPIARDELEEALEPRVDLTDEHSDHAH